MAKKASRLLSVQGAAEEEGGGAEAVDMAAEMEPREDSRLLLLLSAGESSFASANGLPEGAAEAAGAEAVEHVDAAGEAG